jgi:cytochrome c556
MKHLRLAAATAAILVSAIVSAPAVAQAPSPQELQRGKDFMQKSMGMMKPELLEKARALPPEIQQFLLKIAIKHSRHSNTLTMRQAMQEILADYQAVAGAIATDNGELAADAARRIADHRLPRGGMLPYLPLEKINARDLGVLPAMEDAVEGSARRLAAAAEKGDMVIAAQQFGTMTSGCVACHAHFRGQPGVSPLIK